MDIHILEKCPCGVQIELKSSDLKDVWQVLAAVRDWRDGHMRTMHPRFGQDLKQNDPPKGAELPESRSTET